MKKLILILCVCLGSLTAKAQVPYFAGTPGDHNLYGYTVLKFRPGVNALESYSCLQYGIGNYFAAGTDFYAGAGSAYWGFLARGGYVFSPWFGIGGQVTPSFDLYDNFRFSYVTTALYMNGQITKDGKLFWVSNTWWTANRNADHTITNWTYLGYTFQFKNGQSLTPMAGCIHSWKFDVDPDLAVGAYYTIGRWNLYVWGNDFFNGHPRINIGVDFKLPTK